MPETAATPMRLSRHATYWECEAEWEHEGLHGAVIWEPLDVDVSADALPYTCYLDTVVFYAPGKRGREELTRTRHHSLMAAPSPHLLYLAKIGGGRWYEVSGCLIVHRDGRWYARWLAWANTRHARAANAGMEAYRA